MRDAPLCASLLSDFPCISRATLQEIVRFELHPFDLYKLDMDMEAQEKAWRGHAGSATDYPTFASLLAPLLVYFDVLGCDAAVASGDATTTLAVLRGCAAYCAHLSALDRTYAWAAVLQHHTRFFLRRAREMARGVYSGWAVLDLQLMHECLPGHERGAPPGTGSRKSRAARSRSAACVGAPAAAEEICFRFNKGTCTGAMCPAGRVHRCRKCESGLHGAFSPQMPTHRSHCTPSATAHTPQLMQNTTSESEPMPGITLQTVSSVTSVVPRLISLLEGVSYQPPAIRKQSKAADSRVLRVGPIPSIVL
ncbi:hypothetical protein BJ912DRAFT_1148100 [Pholiota molesta]|nr:hypothetical protein BJ912DRAFT_1148100 [Pholiota molesta]